MVVSCDHSVTCYLFICFHVFIILVEEDYKQRNIYSEYSNAKVTFISDSLDLSFNCVL